MSNVRSRLSRLEIEVGDYDPDAPDARSIARLAEAAREHDGGAIVELTRQAMLAESQGDFPKATELRHQVDAATSRLAEQMGIAFLFHHDRN